MDIKNVIGVVCVLECLFNGQKCHTLVLIAVLQGVKI